MSNPSQQKGIRVQHPDYITYAPVWKKCRDAAEGERAIHAAGTEYLPKLTDELDDAYKSRRNRTPFFNAFWRTISGLKGMLFRKSPSVKTPAAVTAYLPDIDMAGTPLDLFAQELAEELLTVGRVGVLIDHPPAPSAGVTVAAAEREGLRPTMQQYPSESVINWKSARINNAMKMTLVVLKESVALAGNTDYSHAAEDRYRELTLVYMKPGENADPQWCYRVRVFRIVDEKDVQVGDDLFPLMNGKPLTEIPFVFFGVDDGDSDVCSPPLEDLLNMNLHHYTVSADYEHGCHFSGLPTPYAAGFNPPNDNFRLALGSAAAYCFQDPQAKIAFAELTGDFGALVTNLDGKKSEMAVLGARMLENAKTAVESGETQRQRVAGEQSQLGGMAQVMSMCMTRALTILCKWADAAGEVSYEISRDFVPAGVTPEELTAWTSALQAGKISEQTYFYNLSKGEAYEPGITFEVEQERIRSQGSSIRPEEMA